MRYQHYLKEGEQRDYREEFYEATGNQYTWDFVKQRCAPWFKAIGDYHELIWRGMKNTDSYGTKKVRQDRIPTDTPIFVHDAIGNMFKENYGWNPRSNAMFCSTSEEDVGQYGARYMVFPIGQFKFMWSKRVPDLYNDVIGSGDASVNAWVSTELRKRDASELKDKTDIKMELFGSIQKSKKYHKIDSTYESFLKFLIGEYADYKDTDLLGALRTNNEIMIQCESYFYFHTMDFYMIISKLMMERP